MFGITTLRRRAAVPLLIGALALSGSLLFSTAPAHAAEDTLQVVTPAEGERLDSRTVTVSGMGTPGGLIQIDEQPDLIEVASDGTWESVVVYPEDSAEGQTVSVSQAVGGEPAGSIEQWFSIPFPRLLFVDIPADASTPATRNPTFSGRAPVGSDISASIAGKDVGRARADENGTFRLRLDPGSGEGGSVEILFQGTSGSVTMEPTTRIILLPSSLPAPVVATPVGTTVTGPSVVISGTTTANREVYIELRAHQQTESLEYATGSNGAGEWSLSVDLSPGEYTGHVYLSSFHPNGDVLDSYETEFAFGVGSPTPISGAPVLTPVSVESVTTPQLAATGWPVGRWASGAGVMLALGTALMLTRYRRARGIQA